MADPIFTTPAQETSEIFVTPEPQGSGFNTLDDFLSTRIGMIQDPVDLAESTHRAVEEVKRLTSPELQAHTASVIRKASAEIQSALLESYSTKLASIYDPLIRDATVNEAASAVSAVQQEVSKDEVQALAFAAPAYISKYDPTTYAYQQARADAFGAMIAAQMEQAGLSLDSFGDVAKSIAGNLIPGRLTWQFLKGAVGVSGVGPKELYDSIQNFQRMTTEEQFAAYPAILKMLVESSGGNAIMFQERAMAYLHPEDVKEILAFLSLDAAGVYPLAKGAYSTFRLLKFIRAANTPIKILRNAGRAKEAGEAAAAAAGDAGVAEKLKTTQADAAAMVSPFKGEGLDPAIVDGISAEAQAAIAARVVPAAKGLSPIFDGEAILGLSEFSQQDRAAAQAKYLSQFAGDARVTKEGPTWFEVEVQIQRPSEAAQAAVKDLEAAASKLDTALEENTELLKAARKQAGKKYQEDPAYKAVEAQQQKLLAEREAALRQLDNARGGLNPPPTTETRRVAYRYNDHGEFEAIEYEGASAYINSPSTIIDQMQTGLVGDASLRDAMASRVMHIMNTTLRKAIGGLRKKSRRILDAILVQGDRDMVPFYTIEQLIETGVMTPHGLMKLKSAEEVGAYYAMRRIFDDLHRLKNKDLYRQLEAEGFRALKVGADPATAVQHFIKAVAPTRVKEVLSGVKQVFDDTTGKAIDVGDVDTLAARIADEKNGLRLVRTKFSVRANDEEFSYVITKGDKITDLPEQVLRKRPGYVTKVEKNVFYVAERQAKKRVNGVELLDTSPARFFDNIADARLWANREIAAGRDVRVVAGRDWVEMKPGRRDDFEAHIFGGFYSGERSDAAIPFGLEGTEAERMGGIEAMEMYMNHLSHRISAGEFRMGLIRKFLHSARDAFGNSLLEDPADWRSPLIANVLPEQRRGLEVMRNWITDQLRIPTTEERIWGSAMQRLGEWAAGLPIGQTGRSRAASLPMRLGAKDATAQLRGLAFHATLGWFNPAQLIVQSAGAVFSAAIDPIGFVKNLPRMLALRFSMFATSEDTIRMIARAALQNEDDFVHMIKVYHKTGLHESTLTTGDYLDLQGIGTSMESFRWLANKGLIFFREGERYVRNMAFLQAYDRIGALRGVKRLTDDMAAEAYKLSLKYTLNLNRANRAFWQKGLLSIPTQFLQISAKFIENIFLGIRGSPASSWSRGDIGRIAMAQATIFGAAGFPFGKLMAEHITHWVQSDDDYGLGIKDPKVVVAVSGGLMELMFYEWTGERVDLSSRISVPGNIQFAMELAASGQTSLAETLFGVSSGIGDRVFQASTNILRGLLPIIQKPRLLSKEYFYDVASEVASVTSTWSNYRKAMWWEHQKTLLDSKGSPLVDLSEHPSLILFQKLGLSPKIISDYYEMRDFNKKVPQIVQETARAVIDIGNRYYRNASVLTDPRVQERMRDEINMVTSDLPYDMRRKVLDAVHDFRSKDGYRLNDEIEKALDNMMLVEGSPDLQLNTSMLESH